MTELQSYCGLFCLSFHCANCEEWTAGEGFSVWKPNHSGQSEKKERTLGKALQIQSSLCWPTFNTNDEGSGATQITCDCLFSLKKCQSVRSQVCCSSSCFCCFLPPTLSIFPCWLQEDQSAAAGRIWIFQVRREGCVSHHLCRAERLVPPLSLRLSSSGPWGPATWTRATCLRDRGSFLLPPLPSLSLSCFLLLFQQLNQK